MQNDSPDLNLIFPDLTDRNIDRIKTVNELNYITGAIHTLKYIRPAFSNKEILVELNERIHDLTLKKAKLYAKL